MDYVRSGRLRANQTPPQGASIESLFYASDEAKLPFYSLPRFMPRIWLTREISGTHECLDAYFDQDSDYRLLFISCADELALAEHQFYQYTFSVDQFECWPSGEWVAREKVWPKDVLGPFQVLSWLKQREVTFVAVDDLHQTAKFFQHEGLVFHAEKISVS